MEAGQGQGWAPFSLSASALSLETWLGTLRHQSWFYVHRSQGLE